MSAIDFKSYRYKFVFVANTPEEVQFMYNVLVQAGEKIPPSALERSHAKFGFGETVWVSGCCLLCDGESWMQVSDIMEALKK